MRREGRGERLGNNSLIRSRWKEREAERGKELTNQK